MTSTQAKIAERLRCLSGDIIHKTGDYDRELISACKIVADLVEDGNIDDVIGKSNPTIDDVEEECVRVGYRLSFSSTADIPFDDEDQEHYVDRIRIASERNETRIQYRGRGCEAFAYHALRALPDKVTT